MGLSLALSQAGHAPEQLDVVATCTLDLVDGAPTITAMRLDVVGMVPGLDQAAFEEAAQGAKEGCPVSRALKGNLVITLTARLA